MNFAHQRILSGAVAALTAAFNDADGEPATAATATVTVTRADGTTIAEDGAATADGNTWSYSLTAAQTADLDVLTAAWTADTGATTTTYHEIVGGYYFTVAEAIAAEPSIAGNDSSGLIIATRDEVEKEFEAICGVAFVRRFRRETFDGSGTAYLVAPDPMLRAVTAVTINGVTVDTAGVQCDRQGTIYRSGGWPAGRQNVTVAYEHGYDLPPADLKRAAIQRLRQRLNMQRTGIPDRAVAFTIDNNGSYRLDTAGFDKVGTPDIDAVLARYSLRTRSA